MIRVRVADRQRLQGASRPDAAAPERRCARRRRSRASAGRRRRAASRPREAARRRPAPARRRAPRRAVPAGAWRSPSRRRRSPPPRTRRRTTACRLRVGRGSSTHASASSESVSSSGGRAVLRIAHDGRANHAAISMSRSADQSAAAATCAPAGAHSAAAARASQPAGSTTNPVKRHRDQVGQRPDERHLLEVKGDQRRRHRRRRRATPRTGTACRDRAALQSHRSACPGVVRSGSTRAATSIRAATAANDS